MAIKKNEMKKGVGQMLLDQLDVQKGTYSKNVSSKFVILTSA